MAGVPVHLGLEKSDRLLAVLLEDRQQHGERFGVGVQQQIGQGLWLPGGVIGQDVRGQGALGFPSCRIAKDDGERSEQLVLHRAQGVLPGRQVDGRHANEIAGNLGPDLRPPLAGRVI